MITSCDVNREYASSYCSCIHQCSHCSRSSRHTGSTCQRIDHVHIGTGVLNTLWKHTSTLLSTLAVLIAIVFYSISYQNIKQ